MNSTIWVGSTSTSHIELTQKQQYKDKYINNLLIINAITVGVLNMYASNANSVVANSQSGAAASGVNGLATSQTANAFTQNLTRNLTNNLTAAVVDSAINNKPLNADTLANALKSSLITSGMASGANAIGDAAANADINAFTQNVAHAVLGCAGGAATAGSGGCGAGAVGAVVGEMAADYYMSNKQDPKLSADQNKTNALAFAKVVSAASGIVAGGGGDNVAAVNVAGTTGANAAQNNRLLHPSEVQKAKELAAKSGGKYTQKQIEDALRNASDSANGENITTGMVIKNPTDPKVITDKGAVFNAGGDGKSLVQVLPNGGNVDPELAGFIQMNAPNYSWSNEQLGKVSPVQVDPNAGLNKITSSASGCVTAECAAGLAPVTKPNDAAAAIGIGTALTGAGAVTGNPVLIGSGVNLLGQGIKSGLAGTNDVNLKESAISGATGSLGAAATEIQVIKNIIQQGGAAATVTNSTIGAGTNVIGDTVNKVVNGEDITVKGVAGNAATGALGGVVLPKNPVVPAAATEVLNALKEKVLQGEDK